MYALLILRRLGVLLAGICMIAVLFRLIAQALGILPPALQGILSAGWQGLFSTLAPVFPALAGLGIVIAVVWLILAGRR